VIVLLLTNSTTETGTLPRQSLENIADYLKKKNMGAFQTILHNVSEGPIMVLLIITMPLCIAATALRFIATRRSGRRIGWEDVCAALALLAFLAYGCLAIAGQYFNYLKFHFQWLKHPMSFSCPGFAITSGVSTEEFTLDQAVETSKVSCALRIRR